MLQGAAATVTVPKLDESSSELEAILAAEAAVAEQITSRPAQSGRSYEPHDRDGWKVYTFTLLDGSAEIEAVGVLGRTGIVGYALLGDITAVDVEASMANCRHAAGDLSDVVCDPEEIAASAPGGALQTDGPGPRVYDLVTDEHVGWAGPDGFLEVEDA